MAKSQKTVLALPQREGVETAASAPVLRPNLKHGSLDHPHHERIRRPTQCLCGPTSTPTAKSSKKPKMQATGDMFPTNWSPPPVEFLTPRARQAGKRAQACRWVGTVGPQSLRRLACWVPSELEQKSQVSDPQGNLASLEELFWNTAGPSQEAAAPLLTPGDSESYINSLDYLLQEKREQALEQEQEKLLAQGCPDLESLDLDEEDLPLTPEHRELVERFSMTLQAIPSVHPGETVFLPRRHPLPCILDYSHVKPRNHLEELFLRSPLAQQLSFLRGGLLSNLYLQAPAPTCPVPLLQWLFQLLTWPPETSSRAFGLLWDLSVDRLFCQSDGDVCMWCPSLREIIEVFHSLGAHSPALYPPGPSQQSERVFKREASLSQGEQQDTPQETALDISLSYIYKLQQLCSALSLVSDHHHNLLALVQFFLDVTSRSRQLRSQLSLVVIARLLDQQETLSLWQEKAQLVELSRLLSLMRPSSLGLYLDSETLPPCQEQQPKASAELDHKVCYLCHSLLTLAGVVVSCQDITPDQWGELQLLCLQLDCHISTHIRESPQAMHRTKLKDLAAQTYIRWQELLSHCQPQAQYCRPWEDV
ncbi:family with sequence similarity 178 member B [Phyllostomus discolor]|uniref:Family with sequence similarity 178 member B n=1 Tax=Phyllostomus discolor TaxID=89673 RepID=A0A833ZVM9_9CHIR|nr:family with sequence similarity 178 member B [Phyllostomus discolor]